MKRLAILGATAHIAKSFLYEISRREVSYALTLFTRRPGVLEEFIAKNMPGLNNDLYRINDDYSTFGMEQYDAIMNCVGIGTLGKHKGDYASYFTVYEKFDNLVIDYLHSHPDAAYLAIGSGAIYGGHFEQPANQNSETRFKVNMLSQQDYYAIARLYSEAKHRSLSKLNIIDIRIFSFFSRFYDPEDSYLVNQLVEAVLKGIPFTTDFSEIQRDFIHPADLCDALTTVINTDSPGNYAFDLCSTKPVKKSKLIDFFITKYGLCVNRSIDFHGPTATRQKENYFSDSPHSLPGGFLPRYSSFMAISTEADHILSAMR